MIYIGTSGFSYKEWVGGFYPEKTPPAKFLELYARSFDTTELNNTFYRIPSEKITAKWAEQVGDDFRFTLKMNQRVTHRKRLRGVDEEMRWFLNGARPLGPKLGCVLVQLPPNFRSDLELLDQFLRGYARNLRLAVEFRHDSWTGPETFDLLRKHGAAWAVAENDDSEAVREITAPFVYVRLRKAGYEPAELAEWAEWLKGVAGDAFVYFKHEEQAPHLASELKALVD